MNTVWLVMMLVGIAVTLIRSPSTLLTTLISAAENALQVAFGMLGVYTVWLGILALVEATGLGRALARALHPAVRLLFGKEISPLAAERIALNASANMLGLGSAATPMGIAAMQALDTGSDRASHAQILLLVINATSIQLVPTTLIGIRASLGSASPADILLPGLLATAISTATGIALCKLCAAVSRRRAARKGG